MGVREFFVSNLLKPINPATSMLLGFFCISWGLWVAWPLWDVFDSAKAFSAARLGEGVWGIGAVVVGLSVLWGAVRPSYVALSIGSGLSAGYWVYVAIVLFLGDWQNTAWLTYGWISIHCAMLYINVRINHEYGHDWSGRGPDVE